MSKTFRGKTSEEYEVEMYELTSNYSEWRSKMHQKKQGYFPVFSELIKPHLMKLSPAAIRLYVYLGIHSDNTTGEIKAKINNRIMTSFFNCTERSLQKWVSELEEAGLIVRIQTRFKGTGKFFLCPYDHHQETSKSQIL